MKTPRLVRICVAALLCLPSLVVAQDAGQVLELRLAGGTFRPFAAGPDAPGGHRTSTVPNRSVSGRRYLVAITRTALDPAQRQRLVATGAELLDYLPVRGYRLRIAPENEDEVRALPFVAWLGELPAHLKVTPELSTVAVDTRVRVILWSGEPETRVREALAGLITAAAPSGKDDAWRIEASVPADRLGGMLAHLAALPEVEAVEPVRAMRFFNQDAVWVHQSFVGPASQQTPIFGEGIFGCGQIVGLADRGQDYDSCFFRDTVNGPPPIAACVVAPCQPAAPALNRRKDIVYYNWSGTPDGDDGPCGHGTHTSGSIAGDDASYADCITFANPGRTVGDGQAPGAKLVVQEFSSHYFASLGGTVWNLTDVAYQNGARIHSNSWGAFCLHDNFGNCIPDGCTVPYDSYARDADLSMWSHPDFLLVYGVGNAGGSSCLPPVAVGSPALAKSVLSVGSVGHGNAANTPTGFSSRGPVEDGRLKPTLAAQGEVTVSAASDGNLGSNNCGTCALSGTSMATPTAAGLAALVREYYTAGFYPGGVRNAGQGFAPSGALVKATLIDGAVAVGAAAPGPDFDAGYGRILLDRTLAFASSGFQLRVDDFTQGLVAGSVVTHAYDVAAGTPFRATLVWSDYPAALNAATARVNELKLEVIDPAGNIWFQTLDPVTGAPEQTMAVSAPHDTLNVEERLVFNSPSPGRWVVRVRGIDVPWGPQPFALVVRGALADCPAPAAPGQPTLSTPADHQVQVSWSAVAGAVAYDVYRRFGACAGDPWVQVAAAVAGTSFLDTTVSGGVAYSYAVTAASDATGFCESARSPCASVVPTGDCFLAPTFAGIQTSASVGLASCSIELSWQAAAPSCGADVRYNVYRATTSGFVPGGANRIARCVSGTSYSDSVGLAHGTTYYYVVRAEDAAAGHGGPCRDGNEDANLVRFAASPDGLPQLGTWSDDAGDTGSAQFTAGPPWTVAGTGGNAGPKVYAGASYAGICVDLTSPPLTLGDPGKGPQLSFATRYDLEYASGSTEGSLGQVEIATGPAFSNWTRVPLTPDYPRSVIGSFGSDCPTTAATTTYFGGTKLTYLTYTASLASWAGGEMKLRFHISGNETYPSGDWWIDDVSVTEAFVPGSCTTVSAGPPPVPDGAAVPGVPLAVAKSGANLLLTWDATRCPAAAVNVYRGVIGNYATFTGGHCGLPATGSATVSMPSGAWFLVAATDGAATDGSWGRTLSGAERNYAGASSACPAITAHVTNNGCP